MSGNSPNHHSEYSKRTIEDHCINCKVFQKIDKKLNFGRLPDVVVNLIGNIILVKKNFLGKIERNL